MKLMPTNDAWKTYVCCAFDDNVAICDTGIFYLSRLVKDKNLGFISVGGFDRSEQVLSFCVTLGREFVFVEASEIFEVTWFHRRFGCEGVYAWCARKSGHLQTKILSKEFSEVYNRFSEFMAEFENTIEEKGRMCIR